MKLALEKDPHTPFYYKLNELTERVKDYVALFYGNTAKTTNRDGSPRKVNLLIQHFYRHSSMNSQLEGLNGFLKLLRKLTKRRKIERYINV